jgi:ribosomal protein L44E
MSLEAPVRESNVNAKRKGHVRAKSSKAELGEIDLPHPEAVCTLLVETVCKRCTTRLPELEVLVEVNPNGAAIGKYVCPVCDARNEIVVEDAAQQPKQPEADKMNVTMSRQDLQKTFGKSVNIISQNANKQTRRLNVDSTCVQCGVEQLDVQIDFNVRLTFGTMHLRCRFIRLLLIIRLPQESMFAEIPSAKVQIKLDFLEKS